MSCKPESEGQGDVTLDARLGVVETPPADPTCHFCFSSCRQQGFTKSYGRMVGEDAPSRIVREAKNFIVMPTLGSFIRGYLLIITKSHYPTMAHLPPALLTELETVYEETRAILKLHYAPPVFFEHGAVNPGSCQRGGGACVDHAHIHAFPAPVDLVPQISESFERRRISDLGELSDQAARRVSYLYFENPAGERYVFDAEQPRPPSQYLRRLLAKAFQMSERELWFNYPGKAELLDTIEELKGWEARAGVDRA